MECAIGIEISCIGSDDEDSFGIHLGGLMGLGDAVGWLSGAVISSLEKLLWSGVVSATFTLEVRCAFVMSTAIGLVASELGLFCSTFSATSEGEVANLDNEDVTRRFPRDIRDRTCASDRQGRFSRFSDPC